MRTLILAGAAALSFAAMPAIAQTTVPMTTEQQSMYDAWTAENRAAYDAWPMETKTYYWTLSPEQTAGWWALTNEQRARIVAMTPEQRAAAWTAINAQMSSRGNTDASASGNMDSTTGVTASGNMDSTTGATASGTMSSGAMASGTMPSGAMASGGMQFVKRETVQPVAASANPAALQSGDLPVCKKGQQDGCINGWEKNKRGNRPLKYWPGKPASEIPGKKPQG